jgi:hypothetical protein
MAFTSTQPVPGLVHIDFDTFTNLGKALIRPQEYAESPKFQDQVFTTSRLKKYMRCFRSTTSRNGRANPYWTYTGFNIPGHYVDGFYEKFPAITSAELTVQKHLKSLDLPSRYYLIGSADKAAKKASWKAGDHELAHALWYLDEDYKAGQREIIAKLPEKYRQSVHDRLLSWGCYGPSVVEDEVHAYLATDTLSKLSQRFRWHVLPHEVEVCHNELGARLQAALGRK